MVGEGKDYHVGVMGHLGSQKFAYETSIRQGAKMLDVYELLGEWFQEKAGLFKEQPEKFNEEGADLLTKDARDAELKAASDKLAALYKGPGEALYRHYLWTATAYNPDTFRLVNYYHARQWNMK